MTFFQLVAIPLVALLFLRSAAKFVRGNGPRRVAGLTAILWLAAGVTIFQPEVTNRFARFVGIGRGADLVLYLVTLSFLASLVYFYHKFRTLNSNVTEIVRFLAIQKVDTQWPRQAGSPETSRGTSPAAESTNRKDDAHG